MSDADFPAALGEMTTRQWEDLGQRRRIRDHDIFYVDLPRSSEPDPNSVQDGMPGTVLVLHGFPTCSYDWRHVAATLSRNHRLVIPDMLGYGFSDKPDAPYSLFAQADIVEELAVQLGLNEVALVTHDMGDSVGGELLARDLDGAPAFGVTRRVVSNGSIYIDEAHLTDAQQLLLSLPDAALPADTPIGPEPFKSTMRDIFGPDTQPSEAELDAQWELLTRAGGNLLAPRLIRYIEERHQHETRWTGALEKHPAPLTIVWGAHDPIARTPMAERLAGSARDHTLIILQGCGHYPMIEDPDVFGRCVLGGIEL